MSEQDLVGGKVNVAKYMALLESESDLKVKLQQLFLKKKKDEKVLNAEIERLTALLENQQQAHEPPESSVPAEEVEALKSQMEALQNRFNVVNGKLSSCRTAYDALEKQNNDNVAQLEKQASELDAARTILEKHLPNKDEASSDSEDSIQEATSENVQEDDLTQIKGVGPKLNSVLIENGVTSFAQIAAWKSADIKKIDQELSFKGRIKRDEWVKQAKKLMKK